MLTIEADFRGFTAEKRFIPTGACKTRPSGVEIDRKARKKGQKWLIYQ